jgi:NAD+ diphosphatase
MTSSQRSRINTFSSLVLDRASDQRDDANWIAERLNSSAARFVVLRGDGRVLVDADRRALRAVVAEELAQIVATEPQITTFLGSAGGAEHFLVHVDDSTADRVAAELGADYLDLRSAGLTLPAFDAGLFAYARALTHWQNKMRFCNVCAAPLKFEAAGHRAKCTNPQCGTEHFPRTDPAIIVIVSHRDRCLLGRGPTWPQRRYSTLAGFVEPGETLEDAVRREVFEESGVRVGECDYFSSQPWPFPASIMLGFTADAEDDSIALGPELAEARWFSVDDIVAGLKSHELVLSPAVSVSYRLIEHWLRENSGLELAALMHDEPFLPARS